MKFIILFLLKKYNQADGCTNERNFTNKNRLCNETACINPKNYLLESIGYS